MLSSHTNPILAQLRFSLPYVEWDHMEHVFDTANGLAWEDADEPDDRPGSEWEAFENHAWKVIERLAALS